MKKLFIETFYFFDLFGSSVNILYKKKEQYNTFIGSLISLGIIVFTSLSFANMMLDLFARQYPNIVSTIQFTPDPPAFELNLDNYFIGIGVSDEFGTPFKNTESMQFFNPTAFFCTQETNSINGVKDVQTNCIVYSMQICSQSEMSEAFKQELQLNEKEFEYVYCVNSTQWRKNPMKIQGVVQSAIWNFIAVELKLCNPNISQCAPQHQVEKLMTNGYLTIVIADRLLDQKKPGNPYQVIKKTIITSYSRLNQKYLQIYLRHSITETIENFFYYFSNKFTQHVLQFQDRVESQASLNNNTNQFFIMNIFLDEKSITYYRTYDNILNILGSIGGLFDTLVFIIGMFILPLTRLSQNIQLVNSIFGFQNKNKISKVQPILEVSSEGITIKRKQSIATALKYINTANKQQQFQIVEQIDQKKSKLLKSFINQKEKKLQLEGLEKITVFCSGPKKKQLDYGLDKIKQKLDINYIILKLIEIDKLKMLILDENQLKLFDYIPKPTIPFTNQASSKDFTFYFNDEKKFSIRVKEAIESYKLSKYKPDCLSQKLINLMDNEIKQFFDTILSIRISKIIILDLDIQVGEDKQQYNEDLLIQELDNQNNEQNR